MIVPVAEANQSKSMVVTNVEKYTSERVTACIDSISAITKDMQQRLHNIEMMQFSKEGSEPCYHVKYRVFKDEIKIEKVEIFYIDSPSMGMQYETKEGNKVSRYPYNWNEFFQDAGLDELKQKNKEGYDNAINFLSEMIDKLVLRKQNSDSIYLLFWLTISHIRKLS